MRQAEPAAWVVYQTLPFGGGATRTAVCSQCEWEAMEAGSPGYRTLIRERIGNEGEAERLARDQQTQSEPPKSSKSSYSALRAAARAERARTPIVARPLAGA